MMGIRSQGMDVLQIVRLRRQGLFAESYQVIFSHSAHNVEMGKFFMESYAMTELMTGLDVLQDA